MIHTLSIKRPTLVIDQAKIKKNIYKMHQKAGANNLRFRPHFKTHQSAIIGQWFKESGVKEITVSSVEMADYFISHGWKDVTLAIPVNPLELPKLNRLSQKARINLVIDCQESLDIVLSRATAEYHIWLKIDVGYHRVGLD